MKLLTVSLIVSLAGICLLLLLSICSQPKLILNSKDLAQGDYVQVTGKIIFAGNYQGFSVIRLDNNVTLTCNCNLKINQTIKAEGIVEEYNSELEINAGKVEDVG